METSRRSFSVPDDPWKRELAEVYREYGDFVRRSAGHLRVRETQLDDVVHDVFIVAHRRLPNFDQARGTLRSWLFGITKRVVLHHRRAAARHQRRLTVVPEPHPSPGPDEALARRRVVQRIDTFLETLSGPKRLVFSLVEIEGMPAVDVARSLDMNINTVYGRLRSARGAFVEYLDRLERDGEGHDGGT
ncbi:MAG: RNA polymerase sigma factor [Nannocystales bacterium]